MNIEDFKDNKEACKVYDLIMNTRESVFLTGKAGTGKSSLLKTILKDTNKKVVVAAPTGIAARNIGGSTLHSTFNLPIGLLFVGSSDLQKIFYREEKLELLQEMQLLVIDEISMVSSYILDCIDYLLRSVRGSNEDFGGVQLLLIGDPYQLSPIVKFVEKQYLLDRYTSEMFFDSNTLKRMDNNFNKIELTHCYRQTDIKFMSILDNIRDGGISLKELGEFNAICKNNIKDERFKITLSSTNDRADQINTSQLAKLPGERFLFAAEIIGKFDIKSCIADQLLYLKIGAHVMFTKNNIGLGIFNGMMGIVEGLTKYEITIRTQDDTIIILKEKEKWSDYEYKVNPNTGDIEKMEVGSMTQFPCKLAFAITIHKSQGLTFKSIKVDTHNGAFAAGQVYVALSRCQSIEGIELVNRLKANEIIVNKRVVEFHKQIAK